MILAGMNWLQWQASVLTVLNTENFIACYCRKSHTVSCLISHLTDLGGIWPRELHINLSRWIFGVILNVVKLLKDVRNYQNSHCWMFLILLYEWRKPYRLAPVRPSIPFFLGTRQPIWPEVIVRTHCCNSVLRSGYCNYDVNIVTFDTIAVYYSLGCLTSPPIMWCEEHL